MFFKEDYTFELGSFSGAVDIQRHITSTAMDQIKRIEKAEGHYPSAFIGFTMADLSYLWATNLELGVETMAIYHKDVKTPMVVIERSTPWKDRPHHQHMAEFVNHHLEKSAKNRRQVGAEFIIRQLNGIAILQIEKHARELRDFNADAAALKALMTIDAGKDDA